MQMLASDLNNPEFVGATNPDSLLFVEFYWHEPVDKWASEEASQAAGKKVVVKRPKQPFVRIMRPGDQTSILETAVREDHKQRWPERWLYWQMSEGLVEDQYNVPGWKLEEWPHLADKPELLRELKFARFYTVDQIAGASDGQVQKLGIGGSGLREQAKVDLRNRMGSEMREELARKDQEIADMKERMTRMEAMMSQAAAPAQEVIPQAVTQDGEEMDPIGPEYHDLVVAYEKKFGTPPHHRMKIETIRERIG